MRKDILFQLKSLRNFKSIFQDFGFRGAYFSCSRYVRRLRALLLKRSSLVKAFTSASSCHFTRMKLVRAKSPRLGPPTSSPRFSAVDRFRKVSSSCLPLPANVYGSETFAGAIEL